MIRDRRPQFTSGFDAVFHAAPGTGPAAPQRPLPETVIDLDTVRVARATGSAASSTNITTRPEQHG